MLKVLFLKMHVEKVNKHSGIFATYFRMLKKICILYILIELVSCYVIEKFPLMYFNIYLTATEYTLINI